MPPPRHEITDDFSALRPPFTHYTQDDLQILHEIVALATRLPGAQSFRNIWRAYDAVLAARSIDPALDSLYFRFILHMQGAPGEDLHEKFVQMLDKLEIDVDHTTFVDVPQEIELKFTRARYEEAEKRRQGLKDSSEEEEDAYHAEDEAQPKKTTRTDLRQLEVRAKKITARAGAVSSEPKRSASAIEAANEAVESHHEELRQRRASAPQLYSYDDPSLVPVSSPRVPEDAANHLYELQLRAVLRRYLRYWHAITVRTAVRRQIQNQQAQAFDRVILLRQAFDTWQERRWFAVVERRAEVRYNQVLLVKAWAAWVRSTAAIVQRTQEVRQRILARKYFNAWRDFVLENENKVRLFRLAGVFGRWKDALAKRKAMADQAGQFYTESLIHRAYWTWFFQLCNILGPKRHNQILLARVFRIWRQRTEKSVEAKWKSDAFCRCRTLQVFFGHWVTQTEKSLERQDVAYDQAEWTLMRRVFDSWRRQAIMKPLCNVMTEYSADRVMYEHFTLWKQRAQNSIAAAELYKHRIVKKAIKNWRLQVRLRVFAEQNEFLEKRRVLKKWVCQERLQLLSRVHDRRVLRRVLTLFKERWKERKNLLQKVGRRVAIARKRRMAADVIARWKERLLEQRSRESTANGVYGAKIMSKALVIWRRQTNDCRIHSDWAQDAFYYFTVKKTIAKWKQALQEAHKRRLKRAYQTVARNRNRRIAATSMRIWLDKARDSFQLSEIAADFDESRLRDTAATALQLWRERLTKVAELDDSARSIYQSRLLENKWSVWHNEYLRLVDLNYRNVLWEYGLALKYLKRWSTQSWDLVQLHQKGVQLQKRNKLSRARTILKYWKEQVEERHYERTRISAESTNIEALEGFSEAIIIQPHTIFRQGTPAIMPTTPSFRSTARGSRHRFLPVTSGTPMGSPSSPLRKFANLRKSVLGRPREPGVEEEEAEDHAA